MADYFGGAISSIPVDESLRLASSGGGGAGGASGFDLGMLLKLLTGAANSPPNQTQADNIKALAGALNAVSKVAGQGSISGTGPQTAPAGTVVAGSEPPKPAGFLDKVGEFLNKDRSNDPNFYGGMAGIGKIGAAIATPGSWQARVGNTAAGLHSNVVSNMAMRDVVEAMRRGGGDQTNPFLQGLMLGGAMGR